MNRNEFSEQFDELVEAFGPAKPEVKAKIYFKYLESIPGSAFKKIVEQWIQSESRFPSISALKAMYHAQCPSSVEKQSCNTCDGYGRVKLGVKIYRADCIHQDRLSSKIPQIKAHMVRGEMLKQRLEAEDLYGKDNAIKLCPELYLGESYGEFRPDHASALVRDLKALTSKIGKSVPGSR